jgi:hypothetical protein
MNILVMLDSKNSLLYYIKKYYVLITIFPTRLESFKKKDQNWNEIH